MTNKAKLPEGSIKLKPDHFIVQELVGQNKCAVPLHTTSDLSGRRNGKPITLFNLVKKSWTTFSAVSEVARQLQVSLPNISYYGLKDRHAYTSQCIGVYGDFNPSFSHPDLVLCQVGEKSRVLRPGGNEGNRFKIQVIADTKSIKIQALESFRNYFGKQRFGKFPNPEIGRMLLEGKFQHAMAELRDDPFVGRQLRTLLCQGLSCSEALLHPSVSRQIGFRILQWQSYLWNKLLSEFDSPPRVLPVWCLKPKALKLYKELWMPDGIDPNTLRHIHIFDRPTIVRPSNIKIEKKLMGWVCSFDLPSGVYATVALSGVFNLSENR